MVRQSKLFAVARLLQNNWATRTPPIPLERKDELGVGWRGSSAVIIYFYFQHSELFTSTVVNAAIQFPMKGRMADVP